MSDVYKNIRGTTSDVFKIGKNGSNIYSRTAIPSNTLGDDGDWCLVGGLGGDSSILKKVDGLWIDSSAPNIIDVTVGIASFPYTPQSSNDIILCDNDDLLSIVIDTIPPKGHMVTIKDIAGTANMNNITMESSTGITFDGETTHTITMDFGLVKFISNGTTLFTI